MKRSNEALVGFVILAGLAVITIGTMWLQGFRFGVPERDMQAVFQGAGQINPGNPVKVRGVQVGRVRRIAVDPGGEVVRVHFRVSDEVPLPADPAVVLSPESMFGDWQVEIVPMDRFPAYRFAQPREPDDLPGYAIPDISQLTATADRISADIEILTERIGIAFSEETAENIASLINNVEAVTERLSALISQQAESFTGITDGLQSATQQIGAAASSAESAFDRVSATLDQDEVASLLEDLAVLTANLRVVSEGLGDTNVTVRQTAMRMDSTFHRIDGLVAALESGEGALGRLIQDPTMAAHLEGVLGELELLLTDIRENPRRYLRLSIF